MALPFTPSTPRSRPGINWAFQAQQYGAALVFTVIVFVPYVAYQWVRGGDLDWYVVNRALAGVAGILVAVVLLQGPLNRLYDRFDRSLQYRKEIGIVMAALAILHALLSFFFLNDRFPKSRYVGEGEWAFTFALLATVGLIILLCVSNAAVMRRVGTITWWRWQSWGIRVLGLFTALHIFILKLPGWIDFYQGEGIARGVHPTWPTGGLIAGWLLVFTLLVRLGERISSRLGKVAWMLLVVGWPIAMVVSFVVG